MSCRKFIELGGFAFVVSSLASVDDHMRAAGYHVLWEYSSHLDTDQFREKSQVLQLTFKSVVVPWYAMNWCIDSAAS